MRGSWWSHEQAHSIFDVLRSSKPDATVAKLVAKKQTLVHRRPLAGARGGRRANGAAWQLDGLAADARAVVEQVDAADGARPVRRARRRRHRDARADRRA